MKSIHPAYIDNIYKTLVKCFNGLNIQYVFASSFINLVTWLNIYFRGCLLPCVLSLITKPHCTGHDKSFLTKAFSVCVTAHG